MKRILIDTNAYVAFKRNDPDIVQLFRTVDYIAINAVVLGELLAGFRCGTRADINRRELDLFLASPRVFSLPITEETADFYALVFEQLRRKGLPIPTNDLWIAASAMQHGLGLVTLDGHFAHVEGLAMMLKGGTL